jgi:hypothetical protein
MSRMQVGRFQDRAAALNYLVEKFSTEKHNARYVIRETDISHVSFTFMKEFERGKKGEVTYGGNGADLSEAIADLFTQLGESVEEVSNA